MNLNHKNLSHFILKILLIIQEILGQIYEKKNFVLTLKKEMLIILYRSKITDKNLPVSWKTSKVRKVFKIKLFGE